MYKNLCHKIIVYVLVGCLSFGVPATTYYKSVHAIEYLGGALAFEEALKWLLAIVGVTAAGSVASQVDWSEVRDQCVEVQLHNGASQAQVSEWWSKLAKGTLDKASSCWDSFLEWSDSLVDSSSGGVSVPSVGASYSDVVSYLNSLTGSSKPIDNNYINESVYAFHVRVSGTSVYYQLFVTDNNLQNLVLIDSSGSVYLNNNRANYYISTSGNSWLNRGNGSSTLWPSAKEYLSSNIYDSSINSYGYDCSAIAFGGSGSGVVDSDWQSAIEVARQNLNLLNRDLPDENASEVSIPMPGLADSDDEASADAYDNIVDAINDGTITLDDGIAQIQDLLHVLVIDDTTDIVQPVRPDPDTGEDQTKEDVIKENKSNMGFTLAGLEKVFPFCIPFDIYAFLTLLVAEPVAPEFDFPVKSVNNQTEEIHIDLSPFEPVAVVVRYIFDFLFIIGLALMTRSLIGGGSSD